MEESLSNSENGSKQTLWDLAMDAPWARTILVITTLGLWKCVTRNRDRKGVGSGGRPSFELFPATATTYYRGFRVWERIVGSRIFFPFQFFARCLFTVGAGQLY